MIVGIGVDVVDLARFDRSLARTPALRDRLFGAAEVVTRDGSPRSVQSLAARFAAKEALVKALGGSTGVRWHDMVVVSDDSGAPSLELGGGARSLASSRGVTRLHLSLSHDGGVAVAYVVAEGPGTPPDDGVDTADDPRGGHGS
ncbi:holo-[acyl-carrier protein] synthase [Frigoribacterium sp. PhB160]|uniref:holo-ACP synthase n=1 Tax=Frigoribacterium sp. PhB160 TaxID=2485192 RepID=UPI000F479B58|nr:holo-ACP synthase [Frigoribacterium sp. PhB160]ROS59034.1 holo-[acyl-carrier protein] synthase [Frigoribacterium sp. PhB160]